MINSDFILQQEDIALPIIKDVFIHLNMLFRNYPNFENWLEHKVLSGLYNGNRSILLKCRENKVAGVAILKNDIEEKKLCCLRIMPEFQNKGFKNLLMFWILISHYCLLMKGNFLNLERFLIILVFFQLKNISVYIKMVKMKFLIMDI